MCPIAIAYSIRQIIKPVFVCVSVYAPSQSHFLIDDLSKHQMHPDFFIADITSKARLCSSCIHEFHPCGFPHLLVPSPWYSRNIYPHSRGFPVESAGFPQEIPTFPCRPLIRVTCCIMLVVLCIKVDAQYDKLAMVVGQTKLTTLVTANMLWQSFSKFRVCNSVPGGSTVIFGDTRIPF